jgi:hypothetical protein
MRNSGHRDIQLTSCSALICVTVIGTGSSLFPISENSSTFMLTAWSPLWGDEARASLCEPGSSFCEFKQFS